MSLKEEIIKESKIFVSQNHGLLIDTEGHYNSPRISSEFMDCSMPMTFDHYSHCSLGCLYCFAYSQKSNNPSFNARLRSIDHKEMIRAFSGGAKTKRGMAMYRNFYKKRFVLHWGGLADPFCNFEKANGIGYEIIEALGQEAYPTLFSFKGSAIFRPKFRKLFEKFAHQSNFAFQVSIITGDDQLGREVEIGVPIPSRRIDAIRMLSEMGYYCLDGNTEIFHKTGNSPYIRRAKLKTVYKTGNNILVNCNGKWIKAKPIRIRYKRHWYKITLRNGTELITTDNHKNHTDVGIKLSKNLNTGDKLLISNKPLNWDSGRGSYNLGRFIGLWIAEGCYKGKEGFKLTFDANESEYIHFTRSFVERLGGHTSTGKINNGIDINVYSPYLKNLLDYYVERDEKCDTIKLNGICYAMSKDFRQGIFTGWEEGDGNSKRQIHSISKNLIEDMFILANTLGIKCSINKKKNKLQVCDTLTKNAKIYSFNPNKSSNNRKNYCEITKIEKYINRKIKFAYCLEVPEGNSFELANGIITHNCILRLRPYIIGISEHGIDELLERSLDAGIRAVSMEFFAMDARSNPGLRKRHKWLGRLIGTKDIHEYFKALSPSERGGYMRLNRKVKEVHVRRVYDFCIKNDLVYACSDPDFKELNTSGSCCGMPSSFPENKELENWTRNQLTWHIKEAKRRYDKTGKIYMFHFDRVFKPDEDTYLTDPAYMNDHIGVSGMTASERRVMVYLEFARNAWNNLNSPGNPRNYFHGKMLPINIDSEGDLIYKYVPSEYEDRWAREK